jgi:hypothetical protein
MELPFSVVMELPFCMEMELQLCTSQNAASEQDL